MGDGLNGWLWGSPALRTGQPDPPFQIRARSRGPVRSFFCLSDPSPVHHFPPSSLPAGSQMNFFLRWTDNLQLGCSDAKISAAGSRGSSNLNFLTFLCASGRGYLRLVRRPLLLPPCGDE